MAQPSPRRLSLRHDRSVLVVRHGLTTWNAAQRWQGWADIDLADTGIAQSEEAAGAMALLGMRFAAVISSDLVRARRTADLLAATTGSPIPSVDQRWRERNIGEWSGLTTPEIEARWPGMLDAWRDGQLECTPGGEDEDHFAHRTMEALIDALRTAANVDGPCLVVSHGGVMRTLDRHTGADMHPVPNLGGRWFTLCGDDVEPGEAIVLHHGDRPVGVAL